MHTTKHFSRILVAVIPMFAIGCDVEQDPDDIEDSEFDGGDVMTVTAGEPASFPLEVQSAMDQAMAAEFSTEFSTGLGVMKVGNDNHNLFIEVSAHAGYKLSFLEIHADDVSLYQGGFPTGVQSFAVTVPFAQLGAACGDQIDMATFAEIGTLTSTGRMSPVGSTSFGGRYPLRCSATVAPRETDGCTMGLSDWQQLASSTLATELPAAWWELQDIQMCGHSLEQIFFANPGSDVWLSLAQQYLAAKLNLGNDAASTEELDAAMSTAAMLLSPCEKIGEHEIALVQTLKAYNVGETGPGPCAG